jgi:hypothetical protein
MSLLLLTDPADQYVARDSAGRLLPFATLTVYFSGTTELAIPVITADDVGVFETVELDAGEYRIELHDAYGRLVWACDPFTCDCDAADPIVFRSPVNQTLSGAVPYPGATLTFTSELVVSTYSPVDVYADAALSRPLPNPLTANAGGWFPPVYLDDAVTYRVVLADAAGNVLRDDDPYACECNVSPPVIDSLDPPTVLVGSGAFTLTVFGENFIASSVVRWAGSDRDTTFVSSTELEADILAADVDELGEFEVTVFNDDGSGESNVEPFEVGGDPYFAFVVALLHLDGDEGSTTIVDEIPGNTWAVTGAAELDTGEVKFGTASVLAPAGGAGNYISVPSEADFGYGTGDFTIELWIKNISGAANAFNIFYDQRTSLNQPRPTLYYPGDGSLRYYASGADRITSPAGTISTSGTTSWHFVAISRVSGTTRLFVDGVQVGSSYADSTNYEASRIVIMQAGDNLAGNIGLHGNIDDVRVTKGVGRYTVNFTPPTEPFPNA